jgi:hypothetical protein
MASKMGVFSKMVVTNDNSKSEGFGGGAIDDIIIMNNNIKLDMSSPISSPMINNQIDDDSNENSIDNHENYLKFEQMNNEHKRMPTIHSNHLNDDDDSNDEILLHSARTNENTNYSDEIILVSSNSIDLDDNYYDSNAANDIDECKDKPFTNNTEKYSSEQNENIKDNFLLDPNIKDKPRRQRLRKNLKPNSNFKSRTKISIQPTMISNQLFAQSQSEIAKRLHKSNPQKLFNKKKFQIFKNLSNGKLYN